MALVSAGFSIAGVNTATSVLLNLKAAATRGITVLEWNIFYAVLSTNAYQLALYRMNAVGTGAITSTAGATHIPVDTAQTVLETAWATTRPSVTGSSFRQFTLPLTLGAGISWPLGNIIPPGGIQVAQGGGLCLQGVNASGVTTGTLNGSVTWDE
jgi:hypothetical protein